MGKKGRAGKGQELYSRPFPMSGTDSVVAGAKRGEGGLPELQAGWQPGHLSVMARIRNIRIKRRARDKVWAGGRSVFSDRDLRRQVQTGHGPELWYL